MSVASAPGKPGTKLQFRPPEGKAKVADKAEVVGLASFGWYGWETLVGNADCETKGEFPNYYLDAFAAADVLGIFGRDGVAQSNSAQVYVLEASAE